MNFILRVSLLMLIILVGELAGSEAWTEYFNGWAERAPGLNDIFPPSCSSATTVAGQADHHQPSSADHLYPVGLPAGSSASHHLPLPAHYPAKPAAEERPTNSQAALNVSVDYDELCEPGFCAHDFDVLAEFLAGGTPGPHGQAHPGLPHLSESHSHTIGGGPSGVPAASEYPFPPSSDLTPGPNQRPPRKRKQDLETLPERSRQITRQKKPRRGKTRLHCHIPITSPGMPHVWDSHTHKIAGPGLPYMPTLSGQRQEFSERLHPQGALVFYWTDFAPNDPSDLVQQMEVDRIVTQPQAIRNKQLVILESEFIDTDRYLRFVHTSRSSKPPRSVDLRGSVTVKPPGSFESCTDDKAAHYPGIGINIGSMKLG
ncbi:hypothetical protein PTTG_08323 [Puccinia triticina 1-1 BBBD Race 1]|uniref:Uncharacterized protein n=1 Tax=Puccinia triticina (isolate 1-1 / race 1 (BBBD)) TaxID=630390 RepID=A0A0C4F5C4_PUCT1|nr:hypothetical protein PTTG_08323 [Puccinia triticina 1-1 BBBD Race 1]